jgi:hypothetical protein
VVGLDLLVDLCQHLLHPLLVGLDILHLPLKTVLDLILDQVNADSGLSVFDTLIVDPEWPLGLGDGVLQLRLGFLQQAVFPAEIDG